LLANSYKKNSFEGCDISLAMVLIQMGMRTQEFLYMPVVMLWDQLPWRMNMFALPVLKYKF